MSHPNQIPPKERIAGQIKPPFHAINGQVFCKIKSTGDQKLLDVRGWSFLTTSCKMTEEEACEYQDNLAKKIASILSKHWKEETEKTEFGTVQDKAKMYMKEAVGKITDEEVELEIATTFPTREPLVTDVKSGKQFILPWKDIATLALQRGLTN